MNKPFTTLAAVVALGAAASMFAGSADAQRSGKQSKQSGGGTLSREESAAIAPVVQAVQAEDWATASAGLPAAQAAAQSPYARYVIGQLQLAVGRGTQSTQLQSQGVDAMVASGAAPDETIGALLGVQADFAIQAQNWAAAEVPLTRLLESDPNNVQRITLLAQIKLRLNKGDEARALFQRALEVSTASGQAAPEELYRRMLAMAYETRQPQESMAASRQLLNAYPSATNWRDALLIYRQLSTADDPQLTLDTRRLMRAAGALESEADYVEYADQLNRAGLPGEVKAVLDEGLSRGKLRAGGAHSELLSRANGTVAEDRAALAGQRAAALASAQARPAIGLADAFAGYGQYAEAAALYRAALGKSGADADLINTRLGAALAHAGQRSEAESAFRAVSGSRADLAAFWLIWLERRPG